MPAAVLIADEASKQSLLHAVLVGLDHLLDHLAADGTGLTAGEVAVVTVLQVDADFGSGFHLELLHSVARCGIDKMITGIVRHSLHLLFSHFGFVCPNISFADEGDICESRICNFCYIKLKHVF